MIDEISEIEDLILAYAGGFSPANLCDFSRYAASRSGTHRHGREKSFRAQSGLPTYQMFDIRSAGKATASPPRPRMG